MDQTRCDILMSENECWMFYTIPTSRIISMAKTNLYLFSLGRKQDFTYSFLSDRSMR